MPKVIPFDVLAVLDQRRSRTPIPLAVRQANASAAKHHLAQLRSAATHPTPETLCEQMKQIQLEHDQPDPWSAANNNQDKSGRGDGFLDAVDGMERELYDGLTDDPLNDYIDSFFGDEL